MQQLRRSLTRELLDFVDALQKGDVELTSISKAAFCKARKKLNFTAFIELNKTFVNAHYQNAEKVWVWKNYRLLACDGSTAEIPNSKEVQKEWGVHQNRKDGKAICMARFLDIYDTQNRLTVSSEIDSYKTSESELLWRQLLNVASLETIEDLKHIEDIYIFDRYFASYLLMFYLYSRKSQFCFRMKERWWKVCEAFYKSGQISSIITLQLPAKDTLRANELGIIHRSIQVRLAKIDLGNGEYEILLTSLCDEEKVTIEDLKELYGYRWPIETSYCIFKHKIELENFSGKSILAIKQDFYAKILIMNFAAVLARPIDNVLKKKTKKKHKHQVNITNALGRLKTAVVDWFIHFNIVTSLEEMMLYLYRTTEPIRKGRKFNRPKLPRKKYHMNYKPV